MDLAEREIRSYVPEPEREQRSKRLQKLRGELCERSFAHCYETGALRRMYVRGADNVFKRVLVQAAAFNIGLLLRTFYRRFSSPY
jgi:transposase